MAKYRVKIIPTEQEWSSYIISRPEANFLQSWNFGEFHKNLGKKVYYCGLYEETSPALNGKPAQDIQVAAFMTVREPAKRGAYLTVAGGPLLDWTSKNTYKQLKVIFSYLSDLAKQENCVFIRFRPQEVSGNDIEALCERLGLKKSPMHLTADLTLQLDLSLSEEDLMKQMRKNTRYEVRKVEKLGVTVEQSKNPADIKLFYDHQLAVAQRHGFVPFSYDFLYEQFKALLRSDDVVMFHSYAPQELGASEPKKLLATAFVIFYNGEAVYHYGISTDDNYRMPGSYACQWAAIKEAKRRGCNRYNFWGIAEKEDKNHRFAGVSTFKRGFGGEEVQYLPAHDLVVNKSRYYLTRVFEMVRKKMRRL